MPETAGVKRSIVVPSKETATARLSIGFAAVKNTSNGNDPGLVVNLVEDAVVAYPEAVTLPAF